MPERSVSLRPADAGDSQRLFNWRNDPLTRAVSLTTDEVAWPDHERWFAATLTNPRRVIYMAETAPDSGAEIDADIETETDSVTETDAVGMVRFDLDESGTSAEVSINMNPDARGRGLGTSTLVAALDTFALEHPNTHTITATIRDSNTASVALFARAGFTRVHDDQPKPDADGVGHYVRAIGA